MESRRTSVVGKAILCKQTLQQGVLFTYSSGHVGGGVGQGQSGSGHGFNSSVFSDIASVQNTLDKVILENGSKRGIVILGKVSGPNSCIGGSKEGDL
jgi:hypothetical protein